MGNASPPPARPSLSSACLRLLGGPGRSRVESFSTFILFKNMSDTFNLDPYVILEIAKSFAEHSGNEHFAK